MDPYLTTYPKTRRQQTEIDPFSPAQTTQFNAGPAFPPALANAAASGLNPASATRYAVLRSQLESSAGQQAMLSALPPKAAADYPDGGQVGTITYQGPEGWNDPGRNFKLLNYAGDGGLRQYESPTRTLSPEAQAGRANADRVKRLATLGERANMATDQLYGPAYRPAVEAMNQRLATEKAAVDAAAAAETGKANIADRETKVKEGTLDLKKQELANAAQAELNRFTSGVQEGLAKRANDRKMMDLEKTKAEASIAASKSSEARATGSDCRNS